MERATRPISQPKPKLSSPVRVRYWRKTPIAATCRTKERNTSHITDLGMAARGGLSIGGKFTSFAFRRWRGMSVAPAIEAADNQAGISACGYLPETYFSA